ncbi:small-conductance mechanosensitive channel [Belliella baltica DSM 15883]|uniref:Small-conductance mechanosensitive channel n=1 Tax=Belliella baltica (strain DSM 15883 / CIP 108006 / LMG 21964 / BA134) TaxID=866536 RepID=I3Z528_BELBD|nr:mechanosensitive ion channel domain-containing protein [Belliella baltica]AFL84346.1 small-conductance mechanosensitive channel [Belliella baltica DSM 15883]
MKFYSIFISIFFLITSAEATLFDYQGLDTLLKVSEKESLQQEKNKEEKPSLEGSIRKGQDYTIQLNRMNFILGKELDTLEIMEDIPWVERLTGVVENRLNDPTSLISIRYLNELDNLLRNIRAQVEVAERKVTARTEELVSVREQIQEIKEDQIFRLDVRDPSILKEYQTAIVQLREQTEKTESLLNEQRVFTAYYQTRISRMMIKISELSEMIDAEKRKAEKALLSKDMAFPWEKSKTDSSLNLSGVFFESLKLNEAILSRYIKNQLGLTIFLSVIFLLFYLWVNNILKVIKAEKEFSNIILERANYVPKNTFLSVIVVFFPILPFIFSNPTISFLTVLNWIIVVTVTVLLYGKFPKSLFRNWLAFVFIFLIYTVSNLYRDINYSERWYLFALSIIGIFLALRIVKFQRSNPDLLPTFIEVLVKFYIAMQVLSILANVFGRFTLSKLLGTAATMSFAQAVGLYLFVLIIMEVIYLQIEVGRKKETEFTSFIDFHGIQKRVKKVFYGIAALIWTYYFLDNISLLDIFIEKSRVFLSTERSLINSTFTFGNILIFFLLVYVSSVVANNIAYFASIKDQQKGESRDKRLGSSILLIRLSVLAVGFLLAVGASGIGFDKIAIVLGALSLGIGFGLQTIVNNLVSGVILAFEKPIQIGDAIEVGGRSGTVKEVGIRSSKILAYDGSEIIIPNGDLLSQHLINWTLSDQKRRVELIIGVSYGSDMDLVSEILTKQLQIDEIMKNPTPKVFLQSFADSAVEFRVLFWVENFGLWIDIRNKVMRGIFASFKENGVEIPFPQRDLNLKAFPNILDEKIKSIGELEELEKLKRNQDSKD